MVKRELAHADSKYAARVGLDELELENFADRYFADRADADPFEWAVINLAEARTNYAYHVTVQWRYAILRMHEVLALILPYLGDDSLLSDEALEEMAAEVAAEKAEREGETA